MQALMLVTICCVMLADYLTLTFNLPGPLKFTPELLSAVVTVYVLVTGMRQRFRLVAPKYLMGFGFMAFIVVCGILTNGVGSGTTLAGMRYYLRAIPFFFVPAVYDFTEPQIKQQLNFLKWLSLLQLPLACFQRYQVWAAGRYTGDPVFGTLMTSGVLSLFLICVALVVIGMFLRDKISKLGLIGLFFLFLLPTTINETKVTVLALPLGLVVTLAIGSPAGKRLRVIGWAMALLVTFGAIFVPVYDAMQAHNPYKKEIVDFFTDEKQVTGYLETKKAGVGSTQLVGRVDAMIIPLRYLARDPVELAFGLGVANASHSQLGENFSGKYFDVFHAFLVTSCAIFILEIGLFGTLLVFLLYWLIFWDSIAVARTDEGLRGAMAVGWTGVVAVITMATLYTTIHAFTSLAYLFWYFSGMIAVRRVALNGIRR